jgi:hypothetical protein
MEFRKALLEMSLSESDLHKLFRWGAKLNLGSAAL